MVSREGEIRQLQGSGREAARERARLEERLAALAASQVDSVVFKPCYKAYI